MVLSRAVSRGFDGRPPDHPAHVRDASRLYAIKNSWEFPKFFTWSSRVIGRETVTFRRPP